MYCESCHTATIRKSVMECANCNDECTEINGLSDCCKDDCSMSDIFNYCPNCEEEVRVIEFREMVHDKSYREYSSKHIRI